LLDIDWTSSEQQQVERELWGCLIVVSRLWRPRRGLCWELTGRAVSSNKWTGNYGDVWLLWGYYEGQDAWFLRAMFKDPCIATCSAENWRLLSRWHSTFQEKVPHS
jgi:hypothetical protein